MTRARARLERQLGTGLTAILQGKSAPAMNPEAGRLAWGWFVDLHQTRTHGFAGPNPISFAEIEAYARLHRWPLAARHIDLIIALDRAYLAHANHSSHLTGGNPQPRGSEQKLSPAAFDAVFG